MAWGGWGAHLPALLTTPHISGRVGGFPATLEAGRFYFRRMLAGVAKPLPFSWRLGPDECSSGYFWLQTIVICNPKFSADLSACGTLGLRGCAGGWARIYPLGSSVTRTVAVLAGCLICVTRGWLRRCLPPQARASFWNKTGYLKMTVTPYSS